MKNLEHGFTLIEVLITLIIIVILISVISVRLISLANSADTAACKTNQYTIITAQSLFFVDKLKQGNGFFAESFDLLLPYIDGGKMPHCPRNGEYRLLPKGEVTCTINDHQKN